MGEGTAELAVLEQKLDGLTQISKEMQETMAQLVRFMHQNESLRSEHNRLAERVSANEREIERWKGAFIICGVVFTAAITIIATLL